MKLLLPAMLFVTSALLAAPAGEMPQGADAAQQRLAAQVSPAIREWVRRQAADLRVRPGANDATAREAVGERFRGQNLSPADLDALVFLVMFEMAQDAERDTREALDQMAEENRRKQRLREQAGATKPGVRPREDTISAMDQMSNPRLQMAVDRRSKAVATLSDLMQKSSVTASNITQNLK
jgi:hypothetical protein